MKMEREHLVPLSTQAAAIVRRRLRSTNGDMLFPGTKFGEALSQNTMIFACYRMGYRSRQTVHGFRGLASTWANEAECYKSDWIELALAHADEDEVRGAYNSALYLSARRRMLQDWADMIEDVLSVPNRPDLDREISEARTDEVKAAAACVTKSRTNAGRPGLRLAAVDGVSR
jgi:integrase